MRAHRWGGTPSAPKAGLAAMRHVTVHTPRAGVPLGRPRLLRGARALAGAGGRPPAQARHRRHRHAVHAVLRASRPEHPQYAGGDPARTAGDQGPSLGTHLEVRQGEVVVVDDGVGRLGRAGGGVLEPLGGMYLRLCRRPPTTPGRAGTARRADGGSRRSRRVGRYVPSGVAPSPARPRAWSSRSRTVARRSQPPATAATSRTSVSGSSGAARSSTCVRST